MGEYQRKTSYWQDAPQPRSQIVLFTTTLEDRIPKDHPVRLLDEILDRMDWGPWEANYHGSQGQPPIHPSILCKVLLFALIRRIRSSRQIEYNLGHSIDFMWLVSGRKIDHTTLSEFRREHQEELKRLYRDMVGLAVELKVADGLMQPGTVIDVDADELLLDFMGFRATGVGRVDGRVDLGEETRESFITLKFDDFQFGRRTEEQPMAGCAWRPSSEL